MSDDVYLIPFQGEMLACKTGLDAVAVKLADGILSGREDANSAEIVRLANVLERYNKPIAAQRLRSQRIRLARV